MDASKVFQKSYQLSMIIVIYFLLFLMFPDGNGNNLANGQQQQETKVNQIAKSNKFSSSSTSKISSGSLKFKNNIKVVKQKQQQKQLSLISNKTTEIKLNSINNNFISSGNQLIQPTSLNSQISQQQQEQITTSGGGNFQNQKQQNEEEEGGEEQEDNYNSQEQQTNDKQQMILGLVDGMPGVDFPGLTTIPYTQFSCNNVPYEPGMYADESTGCQVYHLCFDGRRETFLCSVGTIFNQANLACDFWHQVDCSKSSKYYNLNLEFGKASSEPISQQQAFAVSRLQQKTSFLPNLAPNFINKQLSSFTSSISQQQQLPPKIQQTISASSGSSATSSLALDQPISQQNAFISGSTLSIKANKRQRQQQQQETNQKRGFVSPGRHVKLMNHLSQSLIQQQVSPDSSNRVKLLTRDGGNSVNNSLAKGKLMITTLKVNSKDQKSTNKSPKQSRNNNSKKKNKKVEKTSTKSQRKEEEKEEEEVEGLPKLTTPIGNRPSASKAETVAEANSNDLWRPYTKKKKNGKSRTSGTTRAPIPFIGTATEEGPLSQTISSSSGASSTESSLDSNNYSQTQMEFNGETTTAQNPTQQLDTSSEQPTSESGGSKFFSSTMQTSLGEPEMEVNLLLMTTQMPPTEMFNSDEGDSQIEPSFGGGGGSSGDETNNSNDQSVPMETPDFPSSSPGTLTTNSEQLEGGVISVREAGRGSPEEPEEQPQVTTKPTTTLTSTSTTRALSSFVEYENTTSS